MKSKKQKSTQPSCPIFTMKTGEEHKTKKSTRRSADFLFLSLKFNEEQKTKKSTRRSADFLFLPLEIGEEQKNKSLHGRRMMSFLFTEKINEGLRLDSRWDFLFL